MTSDLGLEHINWDDVDVGCLGDDTKDTNIVPITPTVPPVPMPFEPDWPDPAARFIRVVRPEAPNPPLDLLPPRLSDWIVSAAEAAGAPADYVFGGLLAVTSSLIGNAYWAHARTGWTAPPVLWVMAIGQPSAGKSPALKAALAPLREIEKAERRKVEADYKEWEKKSDLAKMAEGVWKAKVKDALKEGEAPPVEPEDMRLPPPPHVPRLVSNDATIEKFALILAKQPKGALQYRDELAGWLNSMDRYSGASDRTFWLESFGGDSYTVERMSRDPLTVEHLSVSVLGGIQPDPLKTLLFNTDDDGLVARFIPIWPEPAPIKRPSTRPNDAYIKCIYNKLYGLELYEDEAGDLRPQLVYFTNEAEALLEPLRQACRDEEGKAGGLMLSFIGKLPGLVVRLSLILAALDWADGKTASLVEIDEDVFKRAAYIVWSYILPMARRAYAEASLPADDRKALRLVAYIREKRWETFTSREVLRAGLPGMGKAPDLNPVLAMLEDGDVIRPIEAHASQNGGRPTRAFVVNPKAHSL
ncbi:YfjI family protein [Shimia thalassica]|uniref:YfjI family protein n=1 Tax=Shimia thalassica TaxID=1715693 RepID=UPI001C08D0C9|nr:YfjI family protein [Shimia thalassica]MBU2942935.1 DUF3987 domain-containing protein [Shimia thalassica]MDO6502742.1 YfjI family protein [Shimia thalassica]